MKHRPALIAALLLSLLARADAQPAEATGPVIPGYFVLRDCGKVELAAQGELLLEELNCVACHSAGANSRVVAKGAPDLSQAGSRITPEYLRAFLTRPHVIKPGTSMPDLFHASDPKARDGAVDDLVHFLVSQGGPISRPQAIDRRKVTEGRKLFESVGCLACHAAEKGPDTKVPSVPLPELAEKTTVEALSDFLADPLKTRPAGRMPAMNLKRPEADAIAAYLLREQAGKRTGGRSEPFTVDAEKAKMGGQMFSMLGCAACHALADHPPTRPAKGLADLKLDDPQGCLGDQIVKGRPKYDLSADQRAAILAALKNAAAFAKPMEPAGRAIHVMAAMNCFACHQRDGIGGVAADRSDFFKSTSPVDLGDDGRLPPRLTGVGAKLLATAFDKILFHGGLRVRPYVATRMPTFSQERIADLPKNLIKADSSANGGTAATIVPGAEKIGWQLVGVKGLGCVNCHGAKGAASIGVPGPDLDTVRDRITAGYFRRWLADPNKLVPGTRMPAFWPDGTSGIKDVNGGAIEPQANAIWTYLQQPPDDMLLPAGLKLKESDLITPVEGPVVLRAFVTGVSPRTILVGNPQGIHWAFDANTMRLAKAWHGKFFDAAGIWEGRGGKARPPLGEDVIDMPAGPSFAFLDSPGAQWPEPDPKNAPFERNQGGRFKGYTLDKQGVPTFRYILNDVTILETETPRAGGDKAAMLRQFKLAATSGAKDLYFLVASGKTIEPKGPGAWLVDGKQTFHLTGEGGTDQQTEMRDGRDGGKLLVAPVKLKDNAASFTVEISW